MDGYVRIPAEEYETLTELEAYVRKIANRRLPLNRCHAFEILRDLEYLRLREPPRGQDEFDDLL